MFVVHPTRSTHATGISKCICRGTHASSTLCSMVWIVLCSAAVVHAGVRHNKGQARGAPAWGSSVLLLLPFGITSTKLIRFSVFLQQHAHGLWVCPTPWGSRGSHGRDRKVAGCRFSTCVCACMSCYLHAVSVLFGLLRHPSLLTPTSAPPTPRHHFLHPRCAPIYVVFFLIICCCCLRERERELRPPKTWRVIWRPCCLY